jgi:hypothetical protein
MILNVLINYFSFPTIPYHFFTGKPGDGCPTKSIESVKPKFLIYILFLLIQRLKKKRRKNNDFECFDKLFFFSHFSLPFLHGQTRGLMAFEKYRICEAKIFNLCFILAYSTFKKETEKK